MKQPICPLAIFKASPNYGFKDFSGNYVKLTPKAVVIHSADSQLMADPPQSFWLPYGQSTHFWIRGDGAILQMVPLDMPAWGNGQLNRSDGLQSHKKLVRHWYSTQRNPNLDTISIEFTGFGVSRGAAFNPLTQQQLEAWRKLVEWFRTEQWISLDDPEQLLLHRHISATACPDGRFDDIGMFQEISMRQEYIEMVDKLVDLLVGKPNGQPYASVEERLAAVRNAWNQQMRYAVGLGNLQAKVAELEQKSGAVNAKQVVDKLAQTLKRVAHELENESVP